jgi:hypothetical protein
MTSDPFGLAPLKQEGSVADPDEFTWECDLDKCERCREKYLNWKQRYAEDQERKK